MRPTFSLIIDVHCINFKQNLGKPMMPDANLTFLNPLRRGGEEGEYAVRTVVRTQKTTGQGGIFGWRNDSTVRIHIIAAGKVNLDFFHSTKCLFDFSNGKDAFFFREKVDSFSFAWRMSFQSCPHSLHVQGMKNIWGFLHNSVFPPPEY